MTHHHIPTGAEIERVHLQTGMDYLQAYRHCQARAAVLERIAENHRRAVNACLQAWADREQRVKEQP